jgi:putative DNA primase/helicase
VRGMHVQPDSPSGSHTAVRLLRPGYRRSGRNDVAAGLRGGPGGSCKVRLAGHKAGVFRDFATGPPGARKEVLPYTSGAIGGGGPGWHWRAPDAPRPLFGLAAPAARPDAPVLVVEGEKAALAAAGLFPDLVAVTSMGGAGAAAQGDWSALAGRDVTVWPDHDREGRGYARDAARHAHAAGARRIRVVEVPSQFPEKWDVADPPPDGLGRGALQALIAAAKDAPCEPDLPPGFELRDDGLWWTGGGDGGEPAERWVCGRFEFIAEALAAGGRGWGPLLRWRDPDGRTHEWVLARELLHSEGAELERAFEDRGLRVAVDRKARRLLRDCLAGSRIARRVQLVDRASWHRPIDEGGFAYVLAGGASFGPGAGRILLQAAVAQSGGAAAFASAGSLAGWRDEVASLALGNDLLVLSMSVAFAGPLLAVVGMRSCGVHLAGGSRTGKTTAIRLPASAWGPPEAGAQIRS